MRLAVIADPHLHDTTFDPRGDGSGAVRTLADTVASTRVFNESVPAFRAALDDVARRGIGHVLLLGDLTDDGQEYAVCCARRILDEYQSRYGMRFFACVGNHDLFALDGRHQAKRFLRIDGSSDEVGSALRDEQGGAVDVVSPAMRCGGYADFIGRFGDLGFLRQVGDLHWETPLGKGNADARLLTLDRADGHGPARIDASYLVEPVEGLWLLSLDANVYLSDPDQPDGAVDLSEAGWNAALRYKPYLLAWMADVAARARSLGKQLVAFSHYPVLDPLPSAQADELELLGRTDFVRRMPSAETRRAIAETGIKLHLSGHWHVNSTACGYGMVNISVPSLVGFPAGYKIIDLAGGRVAVETIALDAVPCFDLGRPRYEAEVAMLGKKHAALAEARSYPEFLDRHLEGLVAERYVGREWPRGLAEHFTRLSIRDLTRPVGLDMAGFDDAPLLQVVVDWYRLRRGGQMAEVVIGARRLAQYAALVGAYTERSFEPGSLEAKLRIFVLMMGRFMSAPPSTCFTVDTRKGALFES